MAERVVIDPITRIEGHLRMELETDGGAITNAWSQNTQFRGLEMIVKPKEVAGGPLNQFSTAGYKLSQGAKILYEERMVRVESCSSYSDTDEAN